MTPRTWTRAEVEALGVRTDLVTACEAVLGVGRRKAYELVARGGTPFPVVKVGGRYVVPVVPLLRFLDTGEDQRPAVSSWTPVDLTPHLPPR